MCQPKNDEHIIALRRREVSELYLMGWSQEEIAEHLNVSQPTIHRDIRAIQDQWRAESIASQTMLRDKEARKLDMIERAAWDGWMRSLRPGTDGETEEPVGDPRFLSLIHKCCVQRRSLLGLDAIPKEEREKTLGECTDEEFDALMEKLRQDIEAQVAEQEALNAASKEERLEQETKESPVPSVKTEVQNDEYAMFGRGVVSSSGLFMKGDLPSQSMKPVEKLQGGSAGIAPEEPVNSNEASERRDGQELPSSVGVAGSKLSSNSRTKKRGAENRSSG